jgi:hypothetical protein
MNVFWKILFGPIALPTVTQKRVGKLANLTVFTASRGGSKMRGVK